MTATAALLVLTALLGSPRLGAQTDDFPAFVWRQRYFGRELPTELVEPFGGTNVVREEEAEWVRERGYAFYVTSAAGRDDLHLDATPEWDERVRAWIRTRENDALERAPCLTAPTTIARLHSTLARSLEARGGATGFGVSLGDEVSLTPNGRPFDLCRSSTCEERWRAYARARGWPERAPTTDEVRIAIGDGDLLPLGAWLARRRFHHEVLGDTLLALADDVVERGARPGLLGITPATAFGGVDLPRVGGALAFLETYPVVDGRELEASTTSADSLATVFVQDDTPDGVAWQTWEHFLRGGDGIVVWSDAYLEDHPERRTRLAECLARIRITRARHPATAEHAARDVALLHDDDSIAAAWLRDALLDGPTWPNRFPSLQRVEGTYERKATSWLRLVEDAGRLPGSVPFSSAPWSDVRVLILPEVLVLDDADVERLERFLARGGVLIVDGTLGWIDRRGSARDADVLERLHAAAPERVLVPSQGFATYLRDRASPTRRDAAVRLLERALALAHAPPPAVRATATDGTPLLVSVRRIDEDDALLCVALANARGPDRRGALTRTEIVLAPAPREGFEARVEWLHPARAQEATSAAPFAATAPEGDAAVALVRYVPAEAR